MTDTDKLAAEGRELLARARLHPEAESWERVYRFLFPHAPELFIAMLLERQDRPEVGIGQRARILSLLAERDALKAENERLRKSREWHKLASERRKERVHTLRARCERMEGLVREHVDAFVKFGMDGMNARMRKFISQLDAKKEKPNE